MLHYYYLSCQKHQNEVKVLLNFEKFLNRLLLGEAEVSTPFALADSSSCLASSIIELTVSKTLEAVTFLSLLFNWLLADGDAPFAVSTLALSRPKSVTVFADATSPDIELETGGSSLLTSTLLQSVGDGESGFGPVFSSFICDFSAETGLVKLSAIGKSTFSLGMF